MGRDHRGAERGFQDAKRDSKSQDAKARDTKNVRPRLRESFDLEPPSETSSGTTESPEQAGERDRRPKSIAYDEASPHLMERACRCTP